MLGKRSPQLGLFAADHLYLDHVGRESFYGFLATQRGRIFRDEDFAALYCPDNGRASVPPSLLATALVLQTYDRVSDDEATARAAFDLRWKVALGIGIDEHPFAKSTLQLFRAQLIVHEQVRALFQKSLTFARRSGYLKGRKIKAVLDTSFILGRGAVKDTYNLLADGIVKLVRALAHQVGMSPEDYASAHTLPRYFGTSLKGEAAIDWDDPKARQALLREIVADADRLLAHARSVLADLVPDDPKRARLLEAADLLSQILVQDVERRPEGAVLHDGVSPDRVVSVHDPEMRHGRKSATKRFDGHKEVIAVDPESQLIVAAAVLPGNAQDHERALEVVEQAEKTGDVLVEETIGDCAFGDGQTRQEFADAERTLIAKVPQRRDQTYFPKDDFQIDLQTMTCTCPAGGTCQTVVSIGSGKRYGAPDAPLRAFRFDAALCDACPLRPSCVRARLGHGRLVMLHPNEALLQKARAFQKSSAFAPYRKLRQVAEHRLARLMQLGMRQARYFGRTKTLFQLFLAATVANLTLIATKLGMMGDSRQPTHHPTFDLVIPMTLLIVLGILTSLRTARFRPIAAVHR
jgi:Transposase DDE domain/Transposase domain (DUF772)